MRSTRSIRHLLAVAGVSLALAANACTDTDAPTAIAPDGVAALEKANGSYDLDLQFTLDTLAVGDTAHVRAVGTRASAGSMAYYATDAAVLQITSDGLLKGLKLGRTRVIGVQQVAGYPVVYHDVVVATKSGTRKAFADTTTKPTPTPIPPVDTATTPAPTPTPTPSTAVWTQCASSGGTCAFIGVHDVRIGPVGGPYVQQEDYQLQYCLIGYFPGKANPAPGKTLHCDVGPLKTLTLPNPTTPMAGMASLTASSVVVPMGMTGVTTPRSRSTSDVGAPSGDGEGAFRTVCGLAKYAFDDPIVFAGQPGKSHLHQFFGNTGVNASSTPASLAASGGSTCFGGTLNRSAYWVPAMFDSRNGQVQTPDRGIIYYKTGYDMKPSIIQPVPTGLRMVAGDMKSTGIQENVIDWGCRDKWHPNNGFIPTDCPVGDAVRMIVKFPQCWDGKNLDSPDHKSHMAYPIYSNTRDASHCPADHPVALPAITELIDYPVTATSNPRTWRLVSDMYSTTTAGGLSAHGDWMGAWDQTTMNTLVARCLNLRKDCDVGPLGNGQELY